MITLTESEVNERIIYLRVQVSATIEQIAYILNVEADYVAQVIEIELNQINELKNDNTND